MFLSKVTRPVARAVAKKTGLPVSQVTRALDVGLPIAAAAVARRKARKH